MTRTFPGIWIIFCHFLSAVLFFSPVFAEEEKLNRPIQVTTNPGDDFAGSVSSDGKKMVYVSNQSGNLDLWLKFLGPGVHPPDVQLTRHSAEDNSPVISPDGQWVAFVSNRSDPRGDIYLLRLDAPEEELKERRTLLGLTELIDKVNPVKKSGGLVQLTDMTSGDSDPAWSPDQKFVFFTSNRPDQPSSRVRKVSVEGKTQSEVIPEAAVNPSVSPEGRYLAYVSIEKDPTGEIWVFDLTGAQKVQMTSGGALDMSPRWGVDGKSIFFTRYQDDTNHDGELTINDRPNLWSIGFDSFKPGKLRQLTDSGTYDLLPEPGKDILYFTTNKKNGSDIWRLPLSGMQDRLEDYGTALQFSEDLCGESPSSYSCLMVLGNLTHDFEGEAGLARIRYQMARGYTELEHPETAVAIYKDIVSRHQDNRAYRGLAEIELLVLAVRATKAQGAAVYKENSRKSLAQLNRIHSAYKDQPNVSARALLEQGHIYSVLEEQVKALEFYKRVTDGYGSQRWFAAEAAYSQSKVYTALEDQKSLVDAFVQVVKDYYDVQYWARRAIQEILALFEKDPALNKKVFNLQSLEKQYESLPVLAAAVRNRIGELYAQANENLLAKEAYKKTIEKYPDAELERYAALFALAKIYAAEENFQKSLDIYESIADPSSNLKGEANLALQGFIRKTLEKGRWELKVGEVKLALKTFRKLIDSSPKTVEAHRGYILANARLGQAQKVVKFYQERAASDKALPVDHYGLSLALTYLNPPSLEAAEKEINIAMTRNSLDPFFHQTLGWIYEQKERKEAGKGYLERSIHEYEIALALNDEETHPENEGDLMLNLGNGNFLLKNFSAAYQYYRKREKAITSFNDPKRETLFYRRFGESAFKAGYPEEAVAYYKKAIQGLTESENLDTVAELNDRIALAYQDSGHHAKAVQYFSTTLELHRKRGNSASVSRTLRNIANNLYSLDQQQEGQDTKSLSLALNHYFDAIDKLEKFGFEDKREVRESKGLVDVNVETGLNDQSTSQAAFGFDKKGEERLIFNYIGKIYGEFGEYDKAIDYFNKKLALMPKDLDPQKNVQALLERAIILNQIGNFYFSAGDYDAARKYFKDSYGISLKLQNRQGLAVNVSNLSRLLLAQTKTVPVRELENEMHRTIALLEQASEIIDTSAHFANPEYGVYIKNYLGIFYHYLAVHIPDKRSAGGNLSKESLRAAFGQLQQEYDHFKKSRDYFAAALKIVESRFEEEDRTRLASALRQNLELTDQLSGKADNKPSAQPSARTAETDNPLFARWQFKYLEYFEHKDVSSRLRALQESERLLSRLPFGMLPAQPASRAMMEELYLNLTRLFLNQKQFSQALHYSEKGLQQMLIALRQDLPLRFENETRQDIFLEVQSASEKVQRVSAGVDEKSRRKYSRADLEKSMEDYEEILAIAGEEDPILASLLKPSVPELEEVQALLKPGEVILKYQTAYDRIFVWLLTTEKVLGGSVTADANLLDAIRRASAPDGAVTVADLTTLAQGLISPIEGSLTGARSIYLLANGALEFLPWAALPVNGQPLVVHLPITQLASLVQFYHSQMHKNLYNSRLLSVEIDEQTLETVQQKFVSTLHLKGEDKTVDNFQEGLKNFGVVVVDGRTVLGRLNPTETYISVNHDRNRFERFHLEKLLAESYESNFIALNEVKYEFNPELGLSPLAPLIHALDTMGYPGILVHLGVRNPEKHRVFQKEFYERFRQGYPSEALRQAQLAIMKQDPQSFAWARYRYYGFAGMTEEEKNEFAQEHFMDNVKKGIAAFQEKRWVASINSFEKAIALMDLLAEKMHERQIYIALAQAAYNKGDYIKAIRYQKRLLALAEEEGDPVKIAEVTYFLGTLYLRAENYQKSVEVLQRALTIYKENEIFDELAKSYSLLGIAEENSFDYDEALNAFSISLQISKDIGEELSQGRELRRLGRIYYLRLNDFVKAREYFSSALEVFQGIEQTDQIVETLMELGLVAEKESDFDKALSYYREAEEILVAQGEEGSKEALSKAFLFQANSYWFQGDYQNAFKFQRRASKLAEELGDKRQQALIENTLGLIYWTLNDNDRALTHLRSSLKLASEVPSPIDIASAYNNIGLIYRKQKDYPESIRNFGEALKRDVELKSKWGQGYTHRNMGMSYLRMKQLDTAEKHIKKAIALSQEINNNTNLVKSLLELGNLHLEKEACDQAVPVFADTAQKAKHFNIREVEWRALRGWGFCLNRKGKVNDAIATYKRAVEVVDQLRAAIKVEEFQNGFLTDKQDVYKELILLLLDQGKVEESFNFAERAKSRSFIDLLGNQKISLKNDVSQQLYDRLVAQKQVIRRMEESITNAAANEEQVKLLRTQLLEERRKYQDLLIEAKAESPQISSFVTVESISLVELNNLIEPDVALVEYLVTPKELIAWVIRKGNLQVKRTPVGEKELNDLIIDYRDRMQQSAPLEAQAKALYKYLIEPVDPLIQGQRVLGIIPHGHLHYVSFASLQEPSKENPTYLIERHPLFYSPSASVLKFTFARKFQKPSAQVKVLAMGNPDLQDFNYDLPLAELEAKSIQWDFPKIDIFTREKATETWVQEHIGDYQIIHIASHGEFDPVNPLFSSLKLTPDKEHDGSFQVSEVFSLNINADLVTLSACQTGLGEISGGDELIGLNRAFIYAGTHAIVSSLWRVSDISTAVLIKHFYRNYANGNKGESLRKAQLLVKSLYPHPSYWAGFNLTGDYR